MKLIKTMMVLSLLGLVLASAYLYHFYQSPYLPQAEQEKVEVEIARGTTPKEVSHLLFKNGIIEHEKIFYGLGKAMGVWPKLKSAEYLLSPSLSPKQIFEILVSGQGIKRQILVREGENIYQIAKEMERLKIATYEEALKQMSNKSLLEHYGLWQQGIHSLEGYLQPNTYFYEKRDSVDFILRRMADSFFKIWKPEFDDLAKSMRLSRHEVVILSSIVEKETGAAFERPVIASVFLNRLKKRMRLQSDPTTIYGIWPEYHGNITKKMLNTPSAYNTYTLNGLPKGPISNPSLEAILAVLHPQETDYLYFVSKNDGTHMFSKTYAEHLNWVKKLQLDPAARQGKSWRDLKKN